MLGRNVMPSNSSRITFPAILDFEASGFGSSSFPIEVGVVLSSGQRYCALIRPHKTWTHWNSEAEQLHKISRSKLVECGRPVQEVCAELNELAGKTALYSDGWTHDHSWLIRLYHAAAMAPTFKLSPIEAIATEQQLGCWDDTKKSVQQNLGVLRHRASSDALMIQQTFVESRRRAEVDCARLESATNVSPVPRVNDSLASVYSPGSVLKSKVN